MVSKKYFDRAEELLAAVKFSGDNRYMKEVFLGDIALAKGDLAKAKEHWNAVPKEEWLGQYEVGERFNRLNDYEKAIECFNNAYKAQTAPRKMDMMYSLAFLYKKLGRFAEAKKEWELIAETLISDYGMDEDNNDIAWAKDEIAQLKKLLGEA
jgi:tetratricopeptide (TPR) repeat protein